MTSSRASVLSLDYFHSSLRFLDIKNYPGSKDFTLSGQTNLPVYANGQHKKEDLTNIFMFT